MGSPEPNGSPPPLWETGYASGAFDLIHVGHLRYLQAAATRCRRLLVGIPDDAIVARVKGRPPLMSQAERLELVGAFACVGRALPVDVPMDETDRFAAFIEGLAANAVFIGRDWADTPRWRRLGPRLAAKGVAVVFLPATPGISSTRLKERIGAAAADRRLPPS